MDNNIILVEEEIKRVTRGRPKKVKEIVEDETQQTIIKKKVGRPRTVDITDIKEYHKMYYQKNKEKTKGDFLCEKCQCLCSKSNKSRHFKICNSLKN